MRAVHERCVQEATEEPQGKVNSTKPEPARLLAHGLPGSGKTKAMLWLAEYFQEVWGWEQGVHFVYLAPLNSMAARINGFTVHSWGEIPWSMDSPQGGMTLRSGSSDSRNMSSMGSKCEHCHWLFIDECEAVGAEDLCTLEQNTT
jgi:hypothetical protein